MPSAFEYTPLFEVYREVRLCQVQAFNVQLDFSFLSAQWYAVFEGSLPSGISLFQDGSGNLISYGVDEITLSDGEDLRTIELVCRVYENTPSGPLLKREKVIIDIVRDCRPLYDTCKCGWVNIMWLNLKGGVQNYYFNGVRTFEVRQENAKKYIDLNKVSRYSSRGNVYKGEIVSTKNIPQSHVDALDSLRTSIQAWVNVDDNLYPIMIDADTYTKYKSRDKFYDVSMKFIYAEPVNIQTQ